ncbi:Gfo/Idh/MocA family oxidoreductase [Candidatus Altiarchaeota archaeon]
MLKTAVIGVGCMGKHHARVYSELEDVELVGVADLNIEAAEQIAGDYKSRPYSDYKEMLLTEKPDAVSIAVPTIHHKEVALFALEHGIHVLVEKPIAHTVEAAMEISNKAYEKGLTLMVGHIERFNPAVQELKKVIESEKIGQPVAMSARRVGPFTNRISDVGVIIDVGVHDIDIMSYLFNDTIHRAYASAGHSRGQNETHAMIMLQFNQGGTGIIETNRLTPKKIRELTVTGTHGVAIVDYIEQSLTIHNGDTVIHDIAKIEPLKNELMHFIDCLNKGTRPLVNGIEGTHALEVALGAVSSYQNNRLEHMAKTVNIGSSDGNPSYIKEVCAY